MQPIERLETESKEIKEVLTQLMKERLTINLVTSTNLIIPCVISNLEKDTEAFSISLKNKKHLKYLSPETEYSVGCGREGSVYNFMCTCLDDGPYVIRLSVPQEMTVLEQREHKRFATLTLSNPYIEVLMANGNETYLMNDLSQGGLSFLVPKFLANKFEAKQIIEIFKIGKKSFKKPIIGEICHISQSLGGSKSTLKIGVMFIGKPNLK